MITDNRTKLSSYKAKSLEETLELEKDRILNQYENAINRTVEFVNKHPDVPYNISISGGKDSEVLYHLWYEVLNRLDFKPDYEFLFFNTSNEVADVYRYIKAKPEIRIVNPKVGWYQFIKNQNYLLPTLYNRFCCSVYKEGQVRKLFDKKKPRIQVIGMRNKESNKRSDYEFFMPYSTECRIHGSSNIPKAWSKLCPIIDFTNTDIWLLILLKQMYIQPKYRYGWSRVGCAICPFSNSYEDELTKKYYPHIWNRLVNIVTNCYSLRYSGKANGYSLYEYINGGWKSSITKDIKYLALKPTKENVHKFALYKGISDDMARKFWDKYCDKCGKSCSSTEIAMFYKTYGRYENEIDNRNPLCIKCFCSENGITREQYYQDILSYREQGCNLF